MTIQINPPFPSGNGTSAGGFRPHHPPPSSVSSRTTAKTNHTNKTSRTDQTRTRSPRSLHKQVVPTAFCPSKSRSPSTIVSVAASTLRPSSTAFTSRSLRDVPVFTETHTHSQKLRWRNVIEENTQRRRITTIGNPSPQPSPRDLIIGSVSGRTELSSGGKEPIVPEDSISNVEWNELQERSRISSVRGRGISEVSSASRAGGGGSKLSSKTSKRGGGGYREEIVGPMTASSEVVVRGHIVDVEDVGEAKMVLGAGAAGNIWGPGGL